MFMSEKLFHTRRTDFPKTPASLYQILTPISSIKIMYLYIDVQADIHVQMQVRPHTQTHAHTNTHTFFIPHEHEAQSLQHPVFPAV